MTDAVGRDRLRLVFSAVVVAVIATAPVGAEQEPDWFTELPAARRPNLPLPRGVVFGSRDGEYVSLRSGVTLVYVSRSPNPFFIGKFEVTWRQYKNYCDLALKSRESHFIRENGDDFEATDECPAFGVSWADAAGFCSWAGLSLPSESDWEFAAGEGGGQVFPWGNSAGGEHLNFADISSYVADPAHSTSDGFPYVAPVGSYPAGASPFGCLDMAGNVWEWVGSMDGDLHILKGGSWRNELDFCRISSRVLNHPGARDTTFGFRVSVAVD